MSTSTNFAHEYNRIGKWSSCTLTNEPLDIPIVSDYKGNLYNKESILEYLLNPDDFTSNQKLLISHIKSLKDIVELKISKNQSNELICSITGNILGSNGIPYIYLVKCQDIFAKKCLTTIHKDCLKCPVCDLEYSKDDIIVINPEIKEDIINQQERIEKLESLGLTHSLKKQKNKKKRKDNDDKKPDSKIKRVKT
ncbi:Peptidyl-prolyl cis-trans isomerase-like 2 [Wickerhamomyces ciferrii]|uniref:Peptidyl-prolyl cis-trans isomerase-like 2 n=1 Tax=Wickerhamomyces ciferrii (strain ATCC 14091 / BCRC 22168 / CBS 111 / JCM 3599 / NBRC 0793 / NRRL Y-1031 F-60-10) TaxID=1206466 RepID=K0KQP0_WICCF|nr:Peptidyl-prolyl cis-trans isomerase-like 2 [Wickerhamomyces ciferrii]CCH45381.1 Peptidyl-prolyl cis-trans isomerase-like 2 [Wickerhamomyces ciferrii]